MAISAEACVVALLGRDDGARRQLRQALEELGAAVAFEGDLAAASDAGVLGVGPNVVIVNLDDSADDDLDHLQAVFDDPSINVVFNDADVSRTLEGWDLARWARHLAAKVLGHDDTLPPPPQGAVRFAAAAVGLATSGPVVPQFEMAEYLEVDSVPDPIAATAVDLSSAAQLGEPGDASAAAATLADAKDEDLLFDSLNAHTEGAAPEPELALFEATWQDTDAASPGDLALKSEPQSSDELDLAALGVVDFEMELTFEAADSETQDEHEPESDAPVAVAMEVDEDFDWSDAASGASTVDPDTHPDAAGQDEVDDGIDLQSVSWSLDTDTSIESLADDGRLFDRDVAALAAQMDAFELDDQDVDVDAHLEFAASPADAVDELEMASSDDAAQGAAPVASASTSLLSGLSLASLDEPVTPVQSQVATAGFDFSAVSELSLEPLDVDEDAGADPLLVAMGLADAPSLEQFNQAVDKEAPAAGGIERVLVLGASIGGPDALRSFLAELPLGFPAVVLIVQHLESGYFERLGQQLQKSTKVPVKLAAANAAAVPGEVLVIPASERVTLERDGRLTFRPHVSPPQYTPSIDEVLRDVADRFGKRATGIIFSGMAGDGVEGAVYLTSKGGEVWAQDANSCVVSSMVDGARARGVVEFTGSPRELAARCVAKFMR